MLYFFLMTTWRYTTAYMVTLYEAGSKSLDFRKVMVIGEKRSNFKTPVPSISMFLL